tara:strand:+ start:14578 stop:15720 length:1143 start_codon:yes stop_codon:yes gene_type:complete
MFFSFILLKKSFIFLSKKIEPNKKFYSKDMTLWKELNKRNKNKDFCNIKIEQRSRVNKVEKKILICLPPKFGLGDAVEYSIAIKSLIESKKFEKLGVAFCDKYTNIFRDLFLLSDIYPLIISSKEIKQYDNIFHITLEIEALKLQKYKRSNIAYEICKFFGVAVFDFKITNDNKKHINDTKTLTIFPVSTSTIRSLDYNVIKEIIDNFINFYKIKIILDDSIFSLNLEKRIKVSNVQLLKPTNLESLICEISKIEFGIFIDSGPLHLAKIYNKRGVLIETSVHSNILLYNSKNIYPVPNTYSSEFCSGPCGLVDIFSVECKVGCYETNKFTFKKIKKVKNLKNLQRWNKKDINSHFLLNPVGCIKNINIKKTLELIKAKV